MMGIVASNYEMEWNLVMEFTKWLNFDSENINRQTTTKKYLIFFSMFTTSCLLNEHKLVWKNMKNRILRKNKYLLGTDRCAG